jgi:protoheme IX farnesyltransferase
MVATSLALVPVADTGPVYLVAAAVLGVWFLTEAHRMARRVGGGTGRPEHAAAVSHDPAPMRLFHLSITYLTLLFLAVAVTALV